MLLLDQVAARLFPLPLSLSLFLATSAYQSATVFLINYSKQQNVIRYFLLIVLPAETFTQTCSAKRLRSFISVELVCVCLAARRQHARAPDVWFDRVNHSLSLSFSLTSRSIERFDLFLAENRSWSAAAAAAAAICNQFKLLLPLANQPATDWPLMCAIRNWKCDSVPQSWAAEKARESVALLLLWKTNKRWQPCQQNSELWMAEEGKNEEEKSRGRRVGEGHSEVSVFGSTRRSGVGANRRCFERNEQPLKPKQHAPAAELLPQLIHLLSICTANQPFALSTKQSLKEGREGK